MTHSAESYFTLNQEAIETMRRGNLEAYFNKLLTLQELRSSLALQSK